MAEASTLFGCSFGEGGWHHIRETLREYDAAPDIPYHETTLYRFLTGFCPSSICELLDGEGGMDRPLPLFVYPWGTFRTGESDTTKSALTSRFCGPSTDVFVAQEFERIKALYHSLACEGYRPWRYGHSFVGGTFLLARDGTRRFVVLQGNHRLAVLAHLGCERIDVRDAPACLPSVREEDIERWALVKAGACTAPLARRVFRLFFDADGRHVARRLDGWDRAATTRVSVTPGERNRGVRLL